MTAVLPVPSTAPAPTVELGRRARVDACVRRGAVALLWLALLLVASWWAFDGGLADLTAWDTGLTSLGRLTGLVASILLLAQVLLMSRVPLLEHAFGQDRLARHHRLVGFASFDLVLAHILLIVWGYAGGRITSTPSTLWRLVVDYPGMLLAAGGSVCFILVVLTSVKAARRRVRYESWHLLHLYAYLGAGFALPHQLWTGQQLTGSAVRTVFWWTAWALAASAVLVFRVGLPVGRTLRHGVRVTSVVPESPGVHSVYLTGRHLERLRVEPGQFLTWRFLSGPGWTRAHPYSLSAAPDGRSLRITVRTVGDGSSAMAALRPGTRAVLEGPFGRLSPRARRRPEVAFIGAGVGMAPLRALAEGMAYAPDGAVYVERYRDHPLFVREVDTLASERGLRVLRLAGPRRSEDSWLGEGVGPVSDLSALIRWVPDVAERDVFVCGPAAWAALVERTLRAAGVPGENVHVESFAW